MYSKVIEIGDLPFPWHNEQYDKLTFWYLNIKSRALLKCVQYRFCIKYMQPSKKLNTTIID